MRIAILADPLDTQYAGIHVFSRELIQGLLKVDRKNEYFICRAKKTDEFPGAQEIVELINPNIPFHVRIRQFWQIPKTLKQIEPDVVIEPAHFGPFNLPPEIKRVTIIHDLTPVLFPHFHPFGSRLAHRLLLPGVLKRADHVFAVSENTRNDIHRLYPFTKGKVGILYPGKDEIFLPGGDPSALEKYGIFKPYLLHVGTIEPRKNLDVLVRAFEQVRAKSDTPLQLVLVGKVAWKSRRLIRTIEQSHYSKDILLPGFVDKKDLPTLYSNATIFVYPSIYEGFGIPVLEAMACGAPVVCSNTSSLPEVGGEASVYFDPGSEKELEKNLLELLLDEKRLLEMRQKSLDRAMVFNWEKTAGKLLQELNV